MPYSPISDMDASPETIAFTQALIAALGSTLDAALSASALTAERRACAAIAATMSCVTYICDFHDFHDPAFMRKLTRSVIEHVESQLIVTTGTQN